MGKGTCTGTPSAAGRRGRAGQGCSWRVHCTVSNYTALHCTYVSEGGLHVPREVLAVYIAHVRQQLVLTVLGSAVPPVSVIHTVQAAVRAGAPVTAGIGVFPPAAAAAAVGRGEKGPLAAHAHPQLSMPVLLVRPQPHVAPIGHRIAHAVVVGLDCLWVVHLQPGVSER